MAIRSPMAPPMGELSAKLTERALSAPSGGTSPKGRGLQSADCRTSVRYFSQLQAEICGFPRIGINFQ